LKFGESKLGEMERNQKKRGREKRGSVTIIRIGGITWQPLKNEIELFTVALKKQVTLVVNELN